ncbi:MAG: DNA alkylation repair protein, partial [Candidatus Cloacimonadota bacterium]|nr:DNA alkylation repair protein [Candidatus Cloacimonadota bacterium]
QFLGIKTPQRKQILKEFQYIYGKSPTETFPTFIWELWLLAQREFQYSATNFLQKKLSNLKENSIALIEKLITTKSWWDTVEFLASNIIGDLFQRFPLQKHNYLQKWLQSENIWLQRNCILFQLKYKEKTDVKLLFSILTYLKDTSEFFLNKAIGWAIRQYSKTDAPAVINFTKNNKLSNLS